MIRRFLIGLTGAMGCILVLAGCGSGTSSASTVQSASPTSAAATSSASSTGGSGASAFPVTPVSVSVPDAINPIDKTTIPIGDGNISTTTPAVGSVYACSTSSGGGSSASLSQLPWVDTTTDTWNADAKVHVSGDVSWPNASFSMEVSGGQRVIRTNDLPTGHATGIFPIQTTDPAYQYDGNPNSIEAQNVQVSLPADPTVATQPSCLRMGPIGVLADGVVLFNALDAEDRDAAVHEVLDAQCDGHPQSSGMYHHHDIPSCLMAKAGGADTSTLIGYAFDGFGIYIEKDKNGNLLTNANLDECHGRTSMVMWDGKEVDMYHYDATLEYPYTVGCYRGTPVTPTLQ